MPQQLLNTAQIGSGIKQVRRKGVAQRMRRILRTQPSVRQVLLHHPLNGPWGDWFATFVTKERFRRLAFAAPKHVSLRQCQSQRPTCGSAQRAETLFLPLAPDGNKTAQQVHVFLRQPGSFADTCTRAVEDLQKGLIAK